ncbi:MAG: chemotaxis protein CheD [Opitutales bacterium]|nr:chemotaxis protein CheD [Opitutales bacterium]
MPVSYLNSPALSQRVIVGVGDFAAANNPNAVLSTFALGSCLGVIALDPGIKAAGLLHCMLPDSTLDEEKARDRPAMFTDTGFKLLMRNMLGLGARVHRLRFVIAGGASNFGDQDFFRIGPRNLETLDKIIDTYSFNMIHRFTGGTINRTLHFSLSTGLLQLKTPQGTSEHSCYD